MSLTHAEMMNTKPGHCTTCGAYAIERNTAGQCSACHNEAYFANAARCRRLRELRDKRLIAAGQQAMAEAGVRPGQRVACTVVGWAMTAETYTGTVVIRRGIPHVRLDTPVNRRRYIRWHKGWVPCD